jgi:S-adenosylmethionine:tRNA ribosyltransferase-isomerase
MQLTDFHYDLPEMLIARYPLARRSDSRLLALRHQQQESHYPFTACVDFLRPGDLLVFNNTKVIPARLIGHKKTGGRVEVLVERLLDEHHMLVQMRASKALRVGEQILFSDDGVLTIGERRGVFSVLYHEGEKTLIDLIESLGQVPLPHYMHRLPEQNDKERYQTIYACKKGSVAAPTAGLHFDEVLMEKLQAKNIALDYVTLHIGAGTFSPIRCEKIAQHHMHAEYMEVSSSLCGNIRETKRRGNRVIAVGTTTVRALETASRSGNLVPYAGDTDIFIYPGYSFQVVDALITNLHLPCSSLLMLVCAFGGYEKVMEAYRQAVVQGYRFYSYGDAMWVERS